MTQLLRPPRAAVATAEARPAPAPDASADRSGASGVARLDGLTSLRFVAAAMIVFHHSPATFGLPFGWLEPLPLEHGVSFFFVLSGFILSYVYPALSWRAAPRFWWARIARVWPAHVVGFLLVVLLLAPGEAILPAAANLLLVHAWIPIDTYYFSFNGPSWSISTELGFYLLFPFLIAGFQRTWFWKLGGALLLLVGMIALGNSLDGVEVAGGLKLSLRGLVYVNPLARLPEFVLGMCVWLLWQRVRAHLSRSAARNGGALTARSTAVCTVGEIAAVGLTVLLMYLAAVTAPSLQATYGEAARDWLLHGGGSGLGFAAIIFVVALDRGLLARLLRLPALVLLGEISYSVYLLHQVLLRAIDKAPWFTAIPVEVSFPLYWIVVVVSAYVVWRLVERPARVLLLGLSGGSATQAGTTQMSGSQPAATQPHAAYPSAARVWRTAVLDGPRPTTVAASFLVAAAFAALAIWLQVLSPKYVMWREFFRAPGPESPVARIESSAPARWTVERRQTYTVTATNLGERTWYAEQPAQVFLHVMFVGPDDLDRVDERAELRLPIGSRVPPGGKIDVEVSAMPPRKEGNYRLRHQLEVDPGFTVEARSRDETPVVVSPRR